MAFLLMVFLAGVCMLPTYPAPPWGGPAWLAALLTGGAVALISGLAALISLRVRRPLDRDPTLLHRQLALYESCRHWHGVASLVLYAAGLWVLGWGWMVRSLHGGEKGPGSEVLLILPYILAQALSWVFFYDADRAAHMASHRLNDLAAFAPGGGGELLVPPFGGRWAHVAFQLRQKLALAFLPVLLLVLKEETFRLLPDWMSKGAYSVWPVLLFGVAVLFVGLPLLIRLVLGLRSLPEGPLRTRLLATAKRLGVGLSDILVWNTRSGTANAMIIGLVPWVRYVVFTDRMLEEFTPEEVQAVFGHELGHAKHQHMLFYLGFLALSMFVLMLVTVHHVLPALKAGGNWLRAGWGDVFHEDSDAALVVMMAFLLAYILAVFGLVSRRCERQADVFGCKAVSCGDPDCRGHGEATEYADGPTCRSGIGVFMRALDKVALNGIDRHRPGFLQSWQHGTIAGRVAFLHGMMVCGPVEREFQRQLWVFKWGLAASLVVALVWLVAAYGLK